MAVRKSSGSLLKRQPNKPAPPIEPKSAAPPQAKPVEPPKPREIPARSCGNCAHWANAERYERGLIEPMSQGNCHRNPPPFPVIRADGFCGEFASK